MTPKQKAYAVAMATIPGISQTEAMRKAGYKNPAENSSKVANNPKVIEYIKKLQEPKEKKDRFDAKKRKMILSEIAENPENLPTDRMKAIDILNKMDGTYLKADKIKEREMKLKEKEFEFKKEQANKEDW